MIKFQSAFSKRIKMMLACGTLVALTSAASQAAVTRSLPLPSGTPSADEIIDQVTLKEMPPEDSEQPTDEERLAVISALRDSVKLARTKIKGSGARTVLRRLSHREYENTLATLFDRFERPAGVPGGIVEHAGLLLGMEVHMILIDRHGGESIGPDASFGKGFGPLQDLAHLRRIP